VIRRIADWFDRRTGARRIRELLLDEPLPAGTGWLFTLGSILLGLLAVQLLTGAFLTLYYAPTPDHAYDSIRFIDSTTAGRIVRGLHHFGASFIVIFLVLHLLRVAVYAAYKPPRELTWLSGLCLFGLVLGFALTGYLLPWDQRAYWATVVTINISRLAPLAGDTVAALLQGGTSVGALTLTRWYSLHVIFLPAAVVALIVTHITLMRRQGISGPLRPHGGPASPFYPFHAARDASAVALVLIVLAAFAFRGAPPLEPPADPTDAAYIPRPEWYFLGLFQLLKYFPGRWEVVGAIVVPGIVAAFLALLPWLDRGPQRHPRERQAILTTVSVVAILVVVLTTLGWRDRPVSASPREGWSLKEIGGRTFVASNGCARCHSTTGMSDPLEEIALGRGAEWLTGHMVDPEVIAPGIREPTLVLHQREEAAILAYVRRLARGPYPGFSQQIETAGAVYARHCIGCHVIDGEGGKDGPDLSTIGRKHDVQALRRWIADPESVNPDAEMPAFKNRLSSDQLDLIAAYLSSRR
jgi:quinol-cytochrome oxidoreductase complex cytochrome b subunit